MSEKKSLKFDGGFSRGYYIDKFNPWDASYIETSGYILETLINYTCIKGRKREIISSIDQCINFLLSVQRKNGAFTCIDNNLPQAFDTGQVLYGLLAYYQNAAYLNLGGKQEVKKAIDSACNWLVEAQDNDGTWTTWI